MPIPIEEIESRFIVRTGSPLPPEARGTTLELSRSGMSFNAVCEKLEAWVNDEARYQAVAAKLAPMSDADSALARSELAKGKPVSVVIAIVQEARRRRARELDAAVRESDAQGDADADGDGLADDAIPRPRG